MISLVTMLSYTVEWCVWVCCSVFFFFFKQKTAYEMRISDWSSDVCSSDLLKYGTVNWEISIIQRHEMDVQHGFHLEVLELASDQATAVALQAGEVDIIVSDWLWVSRQRAEGKRYTFVPFSSSVGSDRKSTRLNSSH